MDRRSAVAWRRTCGVLVRPLHRVGRTDRELVRRSRALPASAIDDGLLLLTRSANKSGLWWAVATVLAARKGPTRRGALRGVAAIAGASALANAVAKPLLPRRRPAAEEVPKRRRLIKHPRSSSFPSGHAASAAAFATAVAMESRPAGLALVPVAAAVAYSRIHTGVHWPSDVAAGLGVGVVAARATKHWWPLPAAMPAETAHQVDAPSIDDGEGMLVVANPAAGSDEHDPAEELRRAWPKATVIYPESGMDIHAQLSREIAARGGHIRAVGAAGGDGTVAAVAAIAADRHLPLALIPAGTSNHFARDVGVSSMTDTAEAMETGAAVGVDLAEVEIDNGARGTRRWFVNTASLGGYPEMVRVREKLRQRHPTLPSLAMAAARTLRHARPLRIMLNGKRLAVWSLFVGNGSYMLRGLAPSGRSSLDTGLLDVHYLRADVPYSRARFVLALLTNTLNASHVYPQRDVPALDVGLLDEHRRLAIDGEVGPLGSRFRFRARAQALTVYSRSGASTSTAAGVGRSGRPRPVGRTSARPVARR